MESVAVKQRMNVTDGFVRWHDGESRGVFIGRRGTMGGRGLAFASRAILGRQWSENGGTRMPSVHVSELLAVVTATYLHGVPEIFIVIAVSDERVFFHLLEFDVEFVA